MCKRVVLVACLAVLLSAAVGQAEWKVEFESKTFCPNQNDVTVNVIYAFNRRLELEVVPVVVREIESGAFWTGELPLYDYDLDGNPISHGITWGDRVAISSTTSLYFLGGTGCFDGGTYDGVSPDYFRIYTDSRMPAHPDGMVWVMMKFDVTGILGRFEFDTACVSGSTRIMIVDGEFPYEDHGPYPGTGEVIFNKGIITIAPCDCGVWGDVTGDGMINPADAVCMVNYIYKSIDIRVLPPNCPYSAGDVNCDGTVGPVDNVLYTQYVYNGRTPFPLCDPCAGH